MSLFDHMCSVCNYYMPLAPTVEKNAETKEIRITEGNLERVCKNCSNKTPEKDGLVMEVVIQDEASESYRTFVNEFTKTDPRLPHTSILKCPNEACPSRSQPGVKSDIIYMKYDVANMKFLYLCNIPGCNTQWKSRS
jgi:hypothetical protein